MPLLIWLPTRAAPCAAALAAVLALPAVAGARAVVPAEGLAVLQPAPGAGVPRGGVVEVRVVPDVAPARLTVVVAASPRTDAFNRLSRVVQAEPALAPAPGATEWTAAVGGPDRWTRRPGPYWYQAVATEIGTGGTVVQRVGPVRTLSVTQPAALRRRGPLHGRFGRRGRAAMLVSTAGRPPGVDRVRWRTLVKRSALRWGMRVVGTTRKPVRRLDGRNAVGFGRDVPDGALAVQRDLYVGGVLREQDIVVRRDVPWQPGPQYPSVDQYDLESVLVHELAHLAGNDSHRPRCSNHVLAKSILPGEWWRGPRDFWRFLCPAPASESKGPAPLEALAVPRALAVPPALDSPRALDVPRALDSPRALAVPRGAAPPTRRRAASAPRRGSAAS